MINLKRVLIAAGLSVVCLAIATPGWAQGNQPLPALPGSAIINKVITDSQGRTFTALRVPSALADNLKSGIFASVAQRLDTDRAVHYFQQDGTLTRTVVPLKDSADNALQPDTQTPDDNQPARIVGTVVDPQAGAMAVMAVFNDKSNSKKPAEIRFYTQDNKQVSNSGYKVVYRKLKGNKAGKVAPGDQGVFIAARETCFTFKLEQLCYKTKQLKRDEKIATLAEQTQTELDTAYDYKAKFDTDGALPDVVGLSQRANCARTLSQARQLTAQNLANCTANLIFAAAQKRDAGQPIGLFRVLKPAEFKIYDMQGNKVANLPAGSYLVMDATPAAALQEPGSVGVLFLVNANGKDHYLIPSEVLEGFGAADDNAENDFRGQAAIKDGFIGGQGF